LLHPWSVNAGNIGNFIHFTRKAENPDNVSRVDNSISNANVDNVSFYHAQAINSQIYAFICSNCNFDVINFKIMTLYKQCYKK
jgi:hypothetical protein